MSRQIHINGRGVKVTRRRHFAANWDGSYGYGAGRAHPCVEHVACDYCGARKGKLCIGAHGVHFDTHVSRRDAFTRLKRVQ